MKRLIIGLAVTLVLSGASFAGFGNINPMVGQPQIKPEQHIVKISPTTADIQGWVWVHENGVLTSEVVSHQQVTAADCDTIISKLGTQISYWTTFKQQEFGGN